jgi:type 1 fimbria pilin
MKKILMIGAAISVLFFMVAMASAGDKTATVNGTISDSMCGAKGANADHAACMTKCMGKGAKAVIVTDGDQKVVTIDNPDAIKGHEGHHVAATGEVTGSSIHIDSVKML